MPARTASGKMSQRMTTTAKSGPFSTSQAKVWAKVFPVIDVRLCWLVGSGKPVTGSIPVGSTLI